MFIAFSKQIGHPIKYRLFLLTKLPMAFMAGLKVVSLTEEASAVRVSYKWLNQNPFKSIYFAVLSMAAEMSTGLLAFGQIYKRKPAVSMLVVGLEAKFFKKATGKIVFTCTNGLAIKNAIENSIVTGQSETITAKSIGHNASGELVAQFNITWSFKAKPN
jgi:hypothetical protein